MSPSRSTDRRAWWKSCQICASRSTGVADAAGEHVEGDQLADRELAVDHQLGAEIERSPPSTSLLTNWTDWLAVLPRLSTRKLARDIARELLLPAALHLRLDRHGLQRLGAGDALDQEGLVLRAAAELLVEPAAEQRRRAGRDRDVERQRAEHDPA